MWASLSSAALIGFKSFMQKSLFLRIALLAAVLFGLDSCTKMRDPISDSFYVSLCELYEHPSNWEGKRIMISAMVTQLPRGVYVYPSPSCPNGFRFIKLDQGAIESDALKELASLTASSTGRQEFEAEITGTFDSQYTEDFDAFQFRVVLSEIKQTSSVKPGRPLGAAD